MLFQTEPTAVLLFSLSKNYFNREADGSDETNNKQTIKNRDRKNIKIYCSVYSERPNNLFCFLLSCFYNVRILSSVLQIDYFSLTVGTSIWPILFCFCCLFSWKYVYNGKRYKSAESFVIFYSCRARLLWEYQHNTNLPTFIFLLLSTMAN